jgi:hypothetical protein
MKCPIAVAEKTLAVLEARTALLLARRPTAVNLPGSLLQFQDQEFVS